MTFFLKSNNSLKKNYLPRPFIREKTRISHKRDEIHKNTTFPCKSANNRVLSFRTVPGGASFRLPRSYNMHYVCEHFCDTKNFSKDIVSHVAIIYVIFTKIFDCFKTLWLIWEEGSKKFLSKNKIGRRFRLLQRN